MQKSLLRSTLIFIMLNGCSVKNIKQENEINLKQLENVKAEKFEDFTNSIGMKFKALSTGDYKMGHNNNCNDDPFTVKDESQGCIKSSSSSSDAYPYHQVHVESFYMAETEVTQEQFRLLFPNYAVDNPRPYNPIELCWECAKRFIKVLNAFENTDKYYLPSEEEWEYAARAGTTTQWSFGNNKSNLFEYAWCSENSNKKSHHVATKKPNPWGLYDMHGNVWEWTNSNYSSSYIRPRHHTDKVLRGGSYRKVGELSKSSFRDAARTVHNFGFRVAKRK